MIPQSEILRYRTYSQYSSEIIVEGAIRSGQQTAFLSHSHLDHDLARGVQGFLQSQGWMVYIDWQDVTLPSSPNSETASKIKSRIRQLDWFLFLATKNSIESRWCPWEIGYADGVKTYDDIVILPTTDSMGRFYGNEYLNLYRSLQHSSLYPQLVECRTPGIGYPTGLRAMQPHRVNRR